MLKFQPMICSLIQEIECAFKGTQKGKIGIRQAAAVDSRYNPGDLYENVKLYQAALDADAAESTGNEIPFEASACDPAN